MELANANLSAAYAPFEGYGAPLAAALAPAPTDEFPPEGDEEVAADDLFALPYGDPALQASPWVDKTDAAGERTHARDLLQRQRHCRVVRRLGDD